MKKMYIPEENYSLSDLVSTEINYFLDPNSNLQSKILNSSYSSFKSSFDMIFDWKINLSDKNNEGSENTENKDETTKINQINLIISSNIEIVKSNPKIFEEESKEVNDGQNEEKNSDLFKVKEELSQNNQLPLLNTNTNLISKEKNKGKKSLINKKRKKMFRIDDRDRDEHILIKFSRSSINTSLKIANSLLGYDSSSNDSLKKLPYKYKIKVGKDNFAERNEKEIFKVLSENISSHFTRPHINHNKIILDKILNDPDYVKKNSFMKNNLEKIKFFINMTFGDYLKNIYIPSKRKFISQNGLEIEIPKNIELFEDLKKKQYKYNNNNFDEVIKEKLFKKKNVFKTKIISKKTK